MSRFDPARGEAARRTVWMALAMTACAAGGYALDLRTGGQGHWSLLGIAVGILIGAVLYAQTCRELRDLREAERGRAAMEDDEEHPNKE